MTTTTTKYTMCDVLDAIKEGATKRNNEHSPRLDALYRNEEEYDYLFDDVFNDDDSNIIVDKDDESVISESYYNGLSEDAPIEAEDKTDDFPLENYDDDREPKNPYEDSEDEIFQQDDEKIYAYLAEKYRHKRTESSDSDDEQEEECNKELMYTTWDATTKKK